MQFFFPFSVLKILGEPHSVLPSKIVEDFSIATNRNITVSIVLIYRAVFTTGLVYLDLMSTLMSQWKSLLLAFLQPTSLVTVTSSGRTVKRRFHQLDDDPDQEVSKRFFIKVSFQHKKTFSLCGMSAFMLAILVNADIIFIRVALFESYRHSVWWNMKMSWTFWQ